MTTDIKRKSCRAIILTPTNEILLIKIENPEGSWIGWITPGGGVDVGEDDISALKRELHEELGVVDMNIGPAVWTRTHTFPWKGKSIEQVEIFYLVHVDRFDPQPLEGIPDLADLKDFRWWSMHELKDSSVSFAPSDLYQCLRELIDNGPPARPIAINI